MLSVVDVDGLDGTVDDIMDGTLDGSALTAGRCEGGAGGCCANVLNMDELND